MLAAYICDAASRRDTEVHLLILFRSPDGAIVASLALAPLMTNSAPCSRFLLLLLLLLLPVVVSILTRPNHTLQYGSED